MAWWIAGGVVALALVWLLVVLVIALGSLRRFAYAALALSRRLADGAERLQPRLVDLQGKAEALQGPLIAAQERAAIVQARRGDGPGSS